MVIGEYLHSIEEMKVQLKKCMDKSKDLITSLLLSTGVLPSCLFSPKVLFLNKVDKTSVSSRLPERDQVFGETVGLSKFSVEFFREIESKESGVAERERPLDPPLA